MAPGILVHVSCPLRTNRGEWVGHIGDCLWLHSLWMQKTVTFASSELSVLSVKKIDGLYTTVETELSRTEYCFQGNTVHPNHDCAFLTCPDFIFHWGCFSPFWGSKVRYHLIIMFNWKYYLENCWKLFLLHERELNKRDAEKTKCKGFKVYF